MDYEQKYNELVEKLKKASVDNDWCDERFCCVISSLFPELRESEDEKIRKEIITRIRQAYDTIYEKYEGNPLIEKDDILASFEDIINDYYEDLSLM